MSHMSAANTHRRAAIIANGERIQTRILTDRIRERRNVNKEITARTKPGNQPIKKKKLASDHIFSRGINTSSPKGNPDFSKVKRNSIKNEPKATQEASARRKGNVL